MSNVRYMVGFALLTVLLCSMGTAHAQECGAKAYFGDFDYMPNGMTGEHYYYYQRPGGKDTVKAPTTTKVICGDNGSRVSSSSLSGKSLARIWNPSQLPKALTHSVSLPFNVSGYCTGNPGTFSKANATLGPSTATGSSKGEALLHKSAVFA